MNIINGKKISAKILDKLKIKTQKIFSLYKKLPHIAIILVGNRIDSQIYTSLKIKRAEEVGIKATLYKFDENVEENYLIDLIQKLNNDLSINSILVQLPLPNYFNTDKIIQSIDPQKDVDGFNVYNVTSKKPYAISPVYQAIFECIKYTKISLLNKKVIILSKSEVFSKPLKNIFIKKKADVEVLIYSHNKDIKKHTLQADILITALGIPYLIDKSYVKEDIILIDVGISKYNNKICGDININSFVDSNVYITPVPGGIGPLTIAFALKNTIDLFLLQNKIKSIEK